MKIPTNIFALAFTGFLAALPVLGSISMGNLDAHTMPIGRLLQMQR